MRAVDAHAHLDFEKYDNDREEVIQRAKESLEFVVNAGCNFERNKKSLRLQKRFPDTVVANLGLHPTFESDFNQIEEIKNQIREEDPVAIGEIGLDHHHVKDDDKRLEQRKVFREMLELAEELNKPIVVHTRDAEKQAIDIIDEYKIPNVLLHCFNGKLELAEKAVLKGMKIGVTTQVLYSDRVQSIVEAIEVSDIFLETDSPFLYKWERNEPINVIESAEKIAKIKDISKDEVIQRTSSNASDFFDQSI